MFIEIFLIYDDQFNSRTRLKILIFAQLRTPPPIWNMKNIYIIVYFIKYKIIPIIRFHSLYTQNERWNCKKKIAWTVYRIANTTVYTGANWGGGAQYIPLGL